MILVGDFLLEVEFVSSFNSFEMGLPCSNSNNAFLLVPLSLLLFHARLINVMTELYQMEKQILIVSLFSLQLYFNLHFHFQERPKWLNIKTVNELKTKLGHVIVMILLIGLFDKSKKAVIHSPFDLLCFSASVLLSSGSLFLLSKLNDSN